MSEQADQDALVEVLRDEIAGWTIGSGYYGTSIGTTDANDIADHLIEHVLAQRDRRVAAEALREAADLGPVNFAMTHEAPKWRGYNHLVTTNWLREHADRIEAGE